MAVRAATKYFFKKEEEFLSLQLLSNFQKKLNNNDNFTNFVCYGKTQKVIDVVVEFCPWCLECDELLHQWFNDGIFDIGTNITMLNAWPAKDLHK